MMMGIIAPSLWSRITNFFFTFSSFLANFSSLFCLTTIQLRTKHFWFVDLHEICGFSTRKEITFFFISFALFCSVFGQECSCYNHKHSHIFLTHTCAHTQYTYGNTTTTKLRAERNEMKSGLCSEPAKESSLSCAKSCQTCPWIKKIKQNSIKFIQNSIKFNQNSIKFNLNF